MFTIRPPRPSQPMPVPPSAAPRTSCTGTPLFNETPITRSHSASGSSSTFCRSTTPTLFTRMSTPPSSGPTSLSDLLHHPLHLLPRRHVAADRCQRRQTRLWIAALISPSPAPAAATASARSSTTSTTPLTRAPTAPARTPSRTSRSPRRCSAPTPSRWPHDPQVARLTSCHQLRLRPRVPSWPGATRAAGCRASARSPAPPCGTSPAAGASQVPPTR